MSKSSENVIKSAEAATDPKALSAAADTASQAKTETDKPQGDGKAPYAEDFKAVYARLSRLDDIVARLDDTMTRLENHVTESLSTVNERLGSDAPQSKTVSLEQRLANLEARLAGMTA